MEKYYSQFGEDLELSKIFGEKIGTCVEVGGFDGVTGSNTYHFERKGWHCLVVEPMPDYCQKIRSVRNCEVVEVAASDKTGGVDFYVASGVETLSTLEADPEHFARIHDLSDQEIKKITVKTARLDDILLERGFNEIDFMSIDVEGHEMSVLLGMEFELIQPRILIIEDNSNGESKEVKRYMQSLGYERFMRTGCNDWYAKRNDSLVTFKKIFFIESSIFFQAKWRQLKNYIKKLLAISKK